MTGLVWKDLLVARKTLKSYAIFLLLYLALAVMGAFEFSFVIAMINVMVMMLPIGAFAYDEQAKWDKYAMSLPLGRRAVVGGRYLFVLLILLASAAFGLLSCVLLSLPSAQDLTEALASVLASMGMGLFIADIILPLSYQFGPERARPYLYAVIFLPMVLFFGAYKLGFLDHVDLSWVDALPTVHALGLFALLPLAALAGLAISYFISCRIVDRKEF